MARGKQEGEEAAEEAAEKKGEKETKKSSRASSDYISSERRIEQQNNEVQAESISERPSRLFFRGQILEVCFRKKINEGDSS